MIYVTVKLPAMYHQMSFEEFLAGVEESFGVKNSKLTATRTYELERVGRKFNEKVNSWHLIRRLQEFNRAHENLHNVQNRMDLYREFKIPKKSGGLRTIDAPNEELMNALRELKTIFECDFGALYHTNAYAYIHGRCTVDAVKRHQWNQSQWYAKYDLSNFFGSTTPEFVMKMFEMIFPFNIVMASYEGRYELRRAIDLAFLNGGLPQGTPLSPLITNLIMIPIDYRLTRNLNQFEKQKFIYTRYADDFIISSRYDFDFRKVENMIQDVLAEFGAPFRINEKKTRYGSRAGRNWNLGVMVGANNEITVGWKKKKQFQTMLFNYGMDCRNGIHWPKEDIQHMEGLRSYYKMVEGETIDRIMNFVSTKVGIDLMVQIKADLS